jgi:P-type E1-E2 ATPase
MIGALFFTWDSETYCKDQDFPLTVSNSSLLEEPGQVSILFTDKTGTLTANQMQFKAIYVT